MPTEETKLAVLNPSDLASTSLAKFIGMDVGMMIDTVRAQCFKGKDQPNDFQVAAFISIAHEMHVNPLLPGMLYAYPLQSGGIVPIMGPDGVFKKLTEHPEVESWEVEVLPADVNLAPTHAIARLFRKGVERPLTYTALLSEWKITTNPNWNSRPRHMLQLRALKHVARQIIHGLPYDEDDRHIMQEVNVTPGAEGQPQRPPPPQREATGAAAVAENAEKKKRGKKTEAAIDTTATPVTESPSPASTTPPKAVAEKPAAGNPAPAGTAGPRTVLNAGETAEFTVEVESFVCMPINGVPGVKAVVKGPFAGTVYHLNGAAEDEAKKLTPLPAWQIEKPVKLTLLGKPGAKPGVIFAMVQAVELAQAEAPKGETLE